MLGPDDISQDEMARVMSEVLGMPVRYERQSLEDLAAALAGYGVGDAFVQGMVEMMRAKDDGLDDGVPRTPRRRARRRSAQWCEQVLRPAVLA